VAAGAYWEVDQLLEVFRREVEGCWNETNSADQRREIAAEVTGVLQWARHSILAARSHTQRKLIHLSRQGAYATVGSAQVEQLELNG
jgi:hypothetical protein